MTAKEIQRIRKQKQRDEQDLNRSVNEFNQSVDDFEGKMQQFAKEHSGLIAAEIAQKLINDLNKCNK